ncbi:MAG TPA: hypothetical protein VGW38_15630, partial [Chloroflexota bacterium]|nr:hypothetical protein [Chloroflexota bacterium]
MRLFQRAGWLLLRFVGSYFGLAILPLVIIVVSMSAIATTQADWILFRFISYPGSTFEVLDNADYSGRREVRSSVIRFEGGVADQVREAITTFGGSISAVSHRIVEEAKREEAARTAAGSSSAFSLSADSQRAASAVGLSGAAVQSAMGGA